MIRFVELSNIKYSVNIQIPQNNATLDELKNTHIEINNELIQIKRRFFRNNMYKNNTSMNEDIISIPLVLQKASAGIGKETTHDIDIADMIKFPISEVPKNTTHAIIIDENSMEPKFYDGQIVFIDSNQQCGDGDCGIFAVTINYITNVYCKQLKYNSKGVPYLHSINTNIGDPNFEDNENCILTCIGKIIGSKEK